MKPRPHPDPDPELEALVDQRLKQLPLLAAPRTLAPGVLALLEARLASRWWLRAWWDWPVAARAAFILIALALVGFASSGGWFVTDGFHAGARMLGDRFSTVTDLSQRFAPITESGLALVDRFGASLHYYGAIIGLLAYGACLGAGTALFRIVGKRF